jgi:hypothetical protein
MRPPPTAGPNWEVDGDWGGDPAEFETTIHWLLRDPA